MGAAGRVGIDGAGAGHQRGPGCAVSRTPAIASSTAAGDGSDSTITDAAPHLRALATRSTSGCVSMGRRRTRRPRPAAGTCSAKNWPNMLEPHQSDVVRHPASGPRRVAGAPGGVAANGPNRLSPMRTAATRAPAARAVLHPRRGRRRRRDADALTLDHPTVVWHGAVTASGDVTPAAGGVAVTIAAGGASSGRHRHHRCEWALRRPVPRDQRRRRRGATWLFPVASPPVTLGVMLRVTVTVGTAVAFRGATGSTSGSKPATWKGRVTARARVGDTGQARARPRPQAGR